MAQGNSIVLPPPSERTRAFKALFVDQNGEAWSMMKGRAGFPVVAYPRNGTPVFASDNYLFAFDSLTNATTAAMREYGGRIEDGRIIPSPNTLGEGSSVGHLEIWLADVEKLTLPAVNILAPDVLNDSHRFYDAFIRLNAQKGTIFCSSIALVRQERNLAR